MQFFGCRPVLFINSLITLNTILNGTKLFLHLCEFELCKAYNTRNCTLSM
jgi:hypothetical protein